MKFGKIMAERQSSEWRCVSYDLLKQKIKASDGSRESVQDFHDLVRAEIREVDVFFQQMQMEFSAAPRVRAAADLRLHAVCFEEIIDPAILPCNHRFCWRCLASCSMQGLNSCPLCRKEQSLEPVNLEIETILGCFAEHYYPTNQYEIPRPATSGSESAGPGSYSALSDEFEPGKAAKDSASATNLPAVSFDSPPSSPACRTRVGTPPPPPAPSRARDPPLLKALKCGSVDQVRWALEEDPEAATTFFLDHAWEPPLCACVRLHCGVEIARLLLAKQAHVDARDIDGFTPLALLSKMGGGYEPIAFDFTKFHVTMQPKEQGILRMAQVLLAAGADPGASVPGGGTCVDLSRSAGNIKLARLLLGDRTAADDIEEDQSEVWNTSDMLAADLPLLFAPTPRLASFGTAADLLQRSVWGS